MKSHYSSHWPSLEQIIIPFPVTVTQDTLVINVINLMSQARRSGCGLTEAKYSLKLDLPSQDQSSCVLVVNEGQIVGIFTEADVVRLTASKVDFCNVKISEVMTQPVMSLTFSPDQDVFTALSLLHQHHICHLPILNEQGQLLGLVTQDSIRHLLFESERQRSVIGSDNRLEQRVKERRPKLSQVNVRLQKEIDKRRQIEVELQQRQNQWQALFENALDAILIADNEGRYVDANPAACRLFGVTKQELLRLKIADFAEPGFDMNQEWQRFHQKGQMIGEFRLHRPDGTIRETEFAAVANFLPNYHLSILRDISERKQAEQQIREQAALIDVATDAIFVRDLENRILFWSQGAERLYGWTAEEATNKKANELLYKEPGSQIELDSTTVDKGFWQGELEQVTKDGRGLIVASRWTLMHDKFGQLKSILVVNTDITEKKHLEAQFFRAQRLESLGTMASGIAHDLNNVFGPILIIAQLLQLKLKTADEPIRELLNTLENSTRRGTALVKQILTFARGVEEKQIPLQLAHLLKEVAQVIKQTFPKSIEIQTAIPAETLWMVRADPTQLHQVFMNLAVNARDAMPNGGTLHINAENLFIDEIYAQMYPDSHEGSYVVITVSDTGSGISPEIIDRIFDPFFTTKEVSQSTGLGLSIVLGIIRNCGGFLQVLSEVGKGTQFKIYLPAVEDTTTATAQKERLPEGNGELILIVDDEPLMQQVTKTSLEDYNYRTLLANNGIEAIALYIEHKQEVRAVLIDMIMADMDGLTTIPILHKINPEVKIIATSGLTANSQLALKAGAAAFLLKPYTVQDLLSQLSKLIATTR